MALRSCVWATVMSLATVTGCLPEPAADETETEATPAAPTNLKVVELMKAAHVTWDDNSDNEIHFMVMRKAQGADKFEPITNVDPDKEVYHDASVKAGTTYTYQIIAMNKAGDYASSNEVAFTAP